MIACCKDLRAIKDLAKDLHIVDCEGGDSSGVHEPIRLVLGDSTSRDDNGEFSQCIDK